MICLPFSLPALDLHEIETLAKNDNLQEALEQYNIWLQENRESSEYFSVLKRFLVLQKDREDFFIQMGKDWNLIPKEFSQIYRWAGRQAELSGDPELAKFWYKKSYNVFPFKENLSILLEAVKMDILMGDYVSARTAADFILREDRDGINNNRTLLLVSRIQFLEGEPESSINTWKEIYLNDQVSREVLYWGFILADVLERTELKSELETRILSMYPGEGAAVLSSRWKEARIPDNLFGFFLPSLPISDTLNEKTIETAVREDDSLREVLRIQTGSFVDRDNAEEQVRDLVRKKFTAEINPVVLEGKTYYRVFILNTSALTLPQLMKNLRDAGFEGFPVY